MEVKILQLDSGTCALAGLFDNFGEEVPVK